MADGARSEHADPGARGRRGLSAGAIVAAAGVLVAAGLALPAAAQQHEPPNALILVAKPSLADPNFRRTVVLVTQAADSSTVGVILNRPTPRRLSALPKEKLPAENYDDVVYEGGPVMREVLAALFQSDAPPAAPAFRALDNVYLTIHPANIEALLARGAGRYRLYAGFAGWRPRQLEGELERGDWHILPASEADLFRKDTSTLWDELIAKARARRTAFEHFPSNLPGLYSTTWH